MAVQGPQSFALRILQAQKAVTSPYREHADDVTEQRSRFERWLHRLLPDTVLTGFELFRRRHRYDAIVTAHYRTSLIFGLLSKLLGRKCLHIVKELYLDEAVLRSRRARWIFGWALSRCDCVITNCSAEIAAYSAFLGLPPERFRFLPWPSNLPVLPDAPDDGYVFAAGRSFRDWPVLFAAARAIPEATFVIVAEAGAIAGLDKPANVRLHCDIPREQYLDLLKGARVVVVPLFPTVRSTGQATILEAMSLGKPIVTARTPGVIDYIRDGQNGLFYEPADNQSLADRLTRLLTDPDLRQKLSQGGMRSVQTQFNKVRYARKMIRLLRNLLVRRRSPAAVVPNETVEIISARISVEVPTERSPRLQDSSSR